MLLPQIPRWLGHQGLADSSQGLGDWELGTFVAAWHLSSGRDSGRWIFMGKTSWEDLRGVLINFKGCSACATPMIAAAGELLAFHNLHPLGQSPGIFLTPGIWIPEP